MDRQLAEQLVQGLQTHSHIDLSDPGMFIDLLVASDIPGFSRFYQWLPENSQSMDESSVEYTISLRRVLRNITAKDYQLSLFKRGVETVASAIGIYSSDVLSRRLRSNPDLVELMTNEEMPFSLLGKLQRTDSASVDGTIYRATSPILVIHGALDNQAVKEWEQANTVYEGGKRTLHRISMREYLAH